MHSRRIPRVYNYALRNFKYFILVLMYEVFVTDCKIKYMLMQQIVSKLSTGCSECGFQGCCKTSLRTFRGAPLFVTTCIKESVCSIP